MRGTRVGLTRISDAQESKVGYFLVEKDPVDDDYEVGTEVREIPAYMTEAHHYDAVEIPQLLERSLRERWGISDSTSRRVAGVKAAQVVSARDDLLASSSVAQVCDDAEQRGPRWARRRLAMAARLALETAGYLDAEIGGPALAAACSTRDAELARAFRSTTKTMKAAVDRPKTVARRVLDPQTSELAELHREAGSLKALEEYVEGRASKTRRSDAIERCSDVGATSLCCSEACMGSSVEVFREMGLVRQTVPGESFAESVVREHRQGTLRGVRLSPELPEEATYATILTPMLRLGGLDDCWAVVSDGYGEPGRLERIDPDDPDWLVGEAWVSPTGRVVLRASDGRELVEQAKPEYVGNTWYDLDVVLRLLVRLSDELPSGREFCWFSIGLPEDDPEFPSVLVLTVLDHESAAKLRAAGLSVDPVSTLLVDPVSSGSSG